MTVSRRLFPIACLFVLIFAGCATQPSGSLASPKIAPSPYSRVGMVTQLDKSSATVVVRLDRKNTNLMNELFVRNKKLEIVAVLRPTNIRTENSVGMVVLSGESAIGLEVVQKVHQ